MPIIPARVAPCQLLRMGRAGCQLHGYSLMGVRISWLRLAVNSLFSREASFAAVSDASNLACSSEDFFNAFSASFKSVISVQTTTTPWGGSPAFSRKGVSWSREG